MIPQFEEQLYFSLAQEGTVMKNVFNQLSAEAIYYAYLSKQVYANEESLNVFAVNNNETDMTSTGHRKWLSNKGDELHNCKKNKDLQNKNKLFHHLLCEDYMLVKSRYISEIKEGLYQTIISGYGPKTIKMDKNHNNNKKFIQKSKENIIPKQNPNNRQQHNIKKLKSKFRNSNSDCEDSNLKLTKKNEMYLIWSLAGDYRLMKWKKKREKAEGRYQKYLANRRKRELKKENAQNMMKKLSISSSSTDLVPGLGGITMKATKKYIKKKPYVIQKSLGYDYRHCLKKKKNREDDELCYQLYLANITPPLPPISGAPYIVSLTPKVHGSKAVCIRRPKGKKLNVSFDLPDEDELETPEVKDLILFQSLALDLASMSKRQHCEENEASYQAAIALTVKNNIEL